MYHYFDQTNTLVFSIKSENNKLFLSKSAYYFLQIYIHIYLIQ